MWFKIGILIVLSYFVGAIPISYILCKKLKNIDIRKVGSKNVGATNASRVLGKKWFFIITFLDILKGFLPIFISKNFFHLQSSLILILIALSCILGHIYPVYLNFKGGKGVAVSAGILLAFDFKLVFIASGIFIITLLITKYISLSSIFSALSLPLSYYFLNKNLLDKNFFIFIIFVSLYIIFKHRANIKRIIRGTEFKWGQKI